MCIRDRIFTIEPMINMGKDAIVLDLSLIHI